MQLKLDKSKKYGIAVSGGVDSMVLMHLAHQEGLDAVIITIDHGLRPASKDEVLGVQQVASAYGYPTIIERIDCKQYAQDNRLSIELAGRLLRYEIFARVKSQYKLDYILLAHHLDDQVETMLMRILRGTGLYGLRGIVDRDYFLHPLLSYPKSDIMAYATANNLSYYEDESNSQTVYKRNVIRNVILPCLEESFADYRAGFDKLARVARETEDYLATFLVGYSYDGSAVRFAKEVYNAHPAIFKRSIRKALYDMDVEKDFEEKNYNTLLSIKDSVSGTTAMLGQGLVARIEYDMLIIERASEAGYYHEAFSVSKSYCYAGRAYTFERASRIEKGVTFDLDKVPQGAVIRTRRDGDVFKRCNGKTKSLSDYLTDAKIPLATRRDLLVLAKDNVVLAVLGIEISHAVKVDDNTTNIIKVCTHVD